MDGRKQQQQPGRTSDQNRPESLGGGALTWLPTTGEFGPRGAFGDYERHEKLATRFNLAYTYSPEERQTLPSASTNNTTLRLADSLNVFDTGAFANGVTVEKVRYNWFPQPPE